MTEPVYIKAEGTVSQALIKSEADGWSVDAACVSKVLEDGNPVGWWVFNELRHKDFLIDMMERAVIALKEQRSLEDGQA